MDTQFSTREVPWMKLGKLIDEPKLAKDAAKLGGLNFDVEKRDLFYRSKTDNMLNPIADRSAIVRTDSDQVLGIMSKEYPILQYSEAFDFMDGVADDTTYVAAGALKGGKQGFMVIKAPAFDTDLGINDPHNMFLILRTSHDGSRAVEVTIQGLRERCMNQLTLNTFQKDVPYRWSIAHTSSMHVKLAQAKDALAKLGLYTTAFQQQAQRLAEVQLDDDKARKILTRVIRLNPNAKNPQQDSKIDAILDIWHNSPTVGAEFASNGWGLTNAVSDYYDWGRPGGKPESRFVGALSGQTINAVQRTQQLTLVMA